MTVINNVDLPPHCYTREYLEESGIHCENSILDTNFKRGLGSLYYVTLVLLGIFVLLVCSASFSATSQLLLQVLTILLFINSLCLLARYLFLYALRKKIRLDPAPIVVEPVAMMVITTRRGIFSYPRLYTAVVYKESGALKPKFYMSAMVKGKPAEPPSETALLYKHRSINKYYSIDDEYDYVKQGRKSRKITSEALLNI